jgi:hypothetical protein
LVDRASRNALAELAHHFVAGRITNYELQNRNAPSQVCTGVFRNVVPAREAMLVEIVVEPPQGVPEDLMNGTVFGRGTDDLEYEWTPYPPRPKALSTLLSLLTLGFSNRLMARHWRQQGNSSVWPFMREVDYRRALEQPPYLACAS